MSYETLNPADAKARLDGDDGWIYLDVRTVEEFDAGHVPGAYNIPFLFKNPATGPMPNDAFLDLVKKHFPADAKIVVGCAVGGRSMRACELLAPEGYTNLVNMDGGYSSRFDQTGALVEKGWEARGYPTTIDSNDSRTYSHLGG